MSKKIFTNYAFSIPLIITTVFTITFKSVNALEADTDFQGGGEAMAAGTGRNPSASFDLCAFSENEQKMQNINVFLTFDDPESGERVDRTLDSSSMANQCDPDIDVSGRIYQNSVGFRKKNKPIDNNGNLLRDFQAITSISNPFTGIAGQVINPDERLAIKLLARATRSEPKAVGKAAAEAIDPFLLEPGTYQYSPFINSIALETDEENDFSGITIFANDSRRPNEFLWFLEIVAENLIISVNDLQATFIHNDLLNLDSNQILNNILSSFSISNGRAELTNFEVFRTTYEVDTQITFSEGTEANIVAIGTEIPEPLNSLPTGIALGLGLLLKTKRKMTKVLKKNTTDTDQLNGVAE